MAKMSYMYVLLIVSLFPAIIMHYHLKDSTYQMLILFYNSMQQFTHHSLRLSGIYNTERKAGKLDIES